MSLPVYKCSAYCVAIGYDLPQASSAISEELPFLETRMLKEALVAFDASDKGEKCIVVFPFGVVVTWGFLHEEENKIIEILRSTEIRPLDFVEFEANPISLNSSNFDVIRVCDIEIDRYGYSQKLAFSFAVSQSLKVNFYEKTVESSSGDMHFLSESLSATGSVSMSRKQMSKKIGEVFLKKNMINLNNEILDTPDVIWDDDDLENIYMDAVAYFDINKRMATLNKRLDTMSDLLLLLSEEVRYRSSERTERVILILIFIEVIIAIIDIYFFKLS